MISAYIVVAVIVQNMLKPRNWFFCSPLGFLRKLIHGGTFVDGHGAEVDMWGEWVLE